MYMVSLVASSMCRVGLVCIMIGSTVLTSTGFAIHYVVAHVMAHLSKSSSRDMCHVVGVVALGVGLLC